METCKPVDSVTLLNTQGLSITSARLAILAVLDKNPHAEADFIHKHARRQVRSLSRQSVYDTLNTLTEKGVLRKIQPMGHAARYETRICDNHHHVVCRSCGLTADIDCTMGKKPCLTPSDAHGFALDEAEVIFWGLCPACQKSQSKRKGERP